MGLSCDKFLMLCIGLFYGLSFVIIYLYQRNDIEPVPPNDTKSEAKATTSKESDDFEQLSKQDSKPNSIESLPKNETMKVELANEPESLKKPIQEQQPSVYLVKEVV